ncbi:uncharacterized protein LOC143900633 [Temnothorax americanus]|uniref:uncharacterized protein LOC143900633 n=1 Tax=Temnothorax americanus TaxID=1964332 RepID=UPI004068B3BF
MSDIFLNTWGPEVMLPEQIAARASVACSNVNMTSIDSGVETGNDSNDSSTAQQESQQLRQGFGQVMLSSTMSPDDSSEFPILNTCEDWSDFIRQRSSSEVLSMILLKTLKKGPVVEANIARKKQTLQEKIEEKNKAWNKELLRRHSRMALHYRKLNEPIHRRKGMTHPSPLFECRNERIHQRMWTAAFTNNITLMKRLLDFDVSPNHQDEHGRTPLHISACRGYTEMVRLLLKKGADPNQRDCIGNTPLHLATVNNKLSVVMLLLTAGTDVLALDSYGYNPLQLAKTRLRMLQRNSNNEDMLKVKEEMHNIINMLMAYLQKQENMREQDIETLSNFCSRLSLSNTSDQVQDDVKNLLANINALSITG